MTGRQLEAWWALSPRDLAIVQADPTLGATHLNTGTLMSLSRLEALPSPIWRLALHFSAMQALHSALPCSHMQMTNGAADVTTRCMRIPRSLSNITKHLLSVTKRQLSVQPVTDGCLPALSCMHEYLLLRTHVLSTFTLTIISKV